MKTRKNLITLAIVGILVFAFGAVNASEENVDWDAFSNNIQVALKSDNDGLKFSAVQQVIQYADQFDVKDGIYDIVEIYRSNENVKVRQLALTAISSTQNKWAMDFLSRNLKYEKSESLKKQIYHILNDYEPGSVIAKSGTSDKVEYVFMATK